MCLCASLFCSVFLIQPRTETSMKVYLTAHQIRVMHESLSHVLHSHTSFTLRCCKAPSKRPSVSFVNPTRAWIDEHVSVHTALRGEDERFHWVFDGAHLSAVLNTFRLTQNQVPVLTATSPQHQQRCLLICLAWEHSFNNPKAHVRTR